MCVLVFRACSELLLCRYEKKFLREFNFADRRFFLYFIGTHFCDCKKLFFFSLLGIKFCDFQEVSLVGITTLHFLLPYMQSPSETTCRDLISVSLRGRSQHMRQTEVLASAIFSWSHAGLCLNAVIMNTLST